jgi:hypothetical protein
MKPASRETIIPPVRPRIGPAPGSHRKYTDRVFCFFETQEKLELIKERSIPEELAGQTTWEALS